MAKLRALGSLTGKLLIAASGIFPIVSHAIVSHAIISHATVSHAPVPDAAVTNVTGVDIHADAPLRIAVMPDVHFHDLYASFDDATLDAAAKVDGKVLMRTMASQLQSTRLFNENYFAFIAALNDAKNQGVSLVLLPGDFSDDGQAIHMRGLRKLLDHYETTHGLRFFATTGNHDPVRPYRSIGGEMDFLDQTGQSRAIVSHQHAHCTEVNSTQQPPTLCSDDLDHVGYGEIVELLDSSGFFPRADDILWETPYGTFNSVKEQNQNQNQNRNKSQALSAQADFQSRGYEICSQGARSLDTQGTFTDCKWVPDASYLVEPVKDVWLLAIDSSVYIPNQNSGRDLQGFAGSGNAGYNAMARYKPQVLAWVESVAARARAQGKTLITFSHFPAAPFYQGVDASIAQTFGKNALQAARVPRAEATQILQRAGINLHLAGHMHVNATEQVSNSAGELTNVQIPSLAAYRPGYLLLEVNAGAVTKQLRALDEVPEFDSLFEYYAREHTALETLGDATNLWDERILSARSYREFTHLHLQALVRKRLLNSQWPAPLRQLIREMTLADLLIASNLPDTGLLDQTQFVLSQPWQLAAQVTRTRVDSHHLSALANVPAIELAFDFYRLLQAGSLALDDVDSARLAQYKILHQYSLNAITEEGKFIHRISGLVLELQQNLSRDAGNAASR